MFLIAVNGFKKYRIDFGNFIMKRNEIQSLNEVVIYLRMANLEQNLDLLHLVVLFDLCPNFIVL